MEAPRSWLIADRAYDIDAFRTGLAQQDIKAVMPARDRRTNQTPASTTRNGIEPRNAVERGLGWFRHGHAWPRATTNNAHRCLGFLYLASSLLWLNSNVNTGLDQIGMADIDIV